MKKLLLAAVAMTGFVGWGSMATAELDLNDPTDDRLRIERHDNARDYSIAVLYLYKEMKVLDDEALARRRWNAMFEHVRWAEENNALDVEMTICSNIEPLQRELIRRWRLEQSSQ
jgi:hypothetical protein